MKHLGHLAIAGAITATIAAIWTPHHWQAGVTALVLLIVGAAILGKRDQELRASMRRHPADGSTVEHIFRGPDGTRDPYAARTIREDHERAQRPTYGRKADR